MCEYDAESGYGYGYRVCSCCGKRMHEGYYMEGDYACSDECAIALYGGDVEKWRQDMEEGMRDVPGEYYWTEWFDEQPLIDGAYREYLFDYDCRRHCGDRLTEREIGRLAGIAEAKFEVVERLLRVGVLDSVVADCVKIPLHDYMDFVYLPRRSR